MTGASLLITGWKATGTLLAASLRRKGQEAIFPTQALCEEAAPRVPVSLIPSLLLAPLDDPVQLNLGSGKEVGSGAPRGAQGARHVIPAKPRAGGFGHGRVLK